MTNSSKIKQNFKKLKDNVDKMTDCAFNGDLKECEKMIDIYYNNSIIILSLIRKIAISIYHTRKKK